MSKVAPGDDTAGDNAEVSKEVEPLQLFAEESNYSVLTEVFKMDCAYACWKMYLCCKNNGPDFLRDIGVGQQVFAQTDQLDAATGGLFYEYSEVLGDACCQLLLWCDAKPGVSYLLENFKSPDAKEERLGDAYIVTDGRSTGNRLCGCDKGHWKVVTSDEKASQLYQIKYYRDACGCFKTHYVFANPPGENKAEKPVIVASKMLKPPAKNICVSLVECCNCSPYSVKNKIQTPDRQLTVPEAYNENSPHSADSMGGKEMSEVSIVEKNGICWMCCGGLKHANVDIPTWYSIGALVENKAKEKGEEDKLNSQFKDSRMMFQDISACTKMRKNCSLSGSDIVGIAGLDQLAVLAEVADAAKEVADDRAAAETTAKGSKVKWVKADDTATGFEFPTYFTTAQKAGLMLMTMEMNISFQ